MKKERIKKPDLTLYKIKKFQQGGTVAKSYSPAAKAGYAKGIQRTLGTPAAINTVKGMTTGTMGAAASAAKKMNFKKNASADYMNKMKADSAAVRRAPAFTPSTGAMQAGGIVKESPYTNSTINKHIAQKKAASANVWDRGYVDKRRAAMQAANRVSGQQYQAGRVEAARGAQARGDQLRGEIQAGTATGVAPLNVGNKGNLYKTSVKYRQ